MASPNGYKRLRVVSVAKGMITWTKIRIILIKGLNIYVQKNAILAKPSAQKNAVGKPIKITRRLYIINLVIVNTLSSAWLIIGIARVVE